MRIRISEQLYLQKITSKDCEKLQQLMQEIYPPVYQHLWEDGGMWYLQSQYAKTHILKELTEVNQAYYFVEFQGAVIGNFRILFNEPHPNFLDKKSVKLHRIYLDSKIHGKGIGKQLLAWLEKTSKEKGFQKLWLEAMDTQEQALNFYTQLGFVKTHTKTLDFPLLHKNLRGMWVLEKEI